MRNLSKTTSFRPLLAQFVARQGDDGASRQLSCLASGQAARNAAPELRIEFQNSALIAVNDGDTDVILLACFKNDILVRLDSEFSLLSRRAYCFINGLVENVDIFFASDLIDGETENTSAVSTFLDGEKDVTHDPILLGLERRSPFQPVLLSFTSKTGRRSRQFLAQDGFHLVLLANDHFVQLHVPVLDDDRQRLACAIGGKGD